MPNPNTLPWLHYQDIQIPDVTLRNQFNNYMLNANFQEAIKILNQNKLQLNGKAYIAETINIMTNALYDIEDRYYQGVIVFLSTQAQKWYNLINNLKRIGTYNDSQEYEINNFVIYNDLVYLAIQKPPIGTAPNDDTYWLLIGLKGEQGAPGIDVVMQYDWNGSTTYSTNDLVVYKDNIYVALKNNAGVEPTTNDSIWLLFLKIDKGYIVVGTDYTKTPTQNSIWFKTSVNPLELTTSDPIYGQFVRYDAVSKTWEEMYPNTVFTWVNGRENYAKPLIIDQINIYPNQWSNYQYTYTNDVISTATEVIVKPTFNITESQQYYYNLLSLSIQNNTAIFTITEVPTNNTNYLPIQILIQ